MARMMDRGIVAPAKASPTSNDEAIAAAGPIWVIDWNSTWGKPIDSALRPPAPRRASRASRGAPGAARALTLFLLRRI